MTVDPGSLPASYREAKAVGATWYFTGKPCSRGHISKRNAKSCNCCACHVVVQKKSRELKPEAAIARRLRCFKADPERALARQRAAGRRYNKNNKHRLHTLRSRQNWARRADTVKRRAGKRKRAPVWLSSQHLLEIKQFYLLAKLQADLTGVRHDVHHIYPMHARECSGLHVPWNMTVITHAENMRLSNKMPEGI